MLYITWSSVRLFISSNTYNNINIVAKYSFRWIYYVINLMSSERCTRQKQTLALLMRFKWYKITNNVQVRSR